MDKSEKGAMSTKKCENSLKPILLSRSHCALIWIFNRYSRMCMEEMAVGAYEDYDPREIWTEAAKEFVRQLKDCWSETFLEALRDEIELTLSTARKKWGKAKRKKCPT